MGSSTSKFRKALQRGEGVEAMQIYLKNPDIKRNLDPNYSYGENHGHNTALHYASMHGIRAFVREFLAEKANPNIRNGFGQNSLHCICFTDRGTELPVDKSRAECLSSLLEWTSSAQDGAAIELDARDKGGNTPLHYAANSGLLQCVKLLVANGASLYEENSNGETACDCAIKQQFNDIASFLESRMVFSGSSSANAVDEPVFIKEEDQKQYRGLCAQDLQEAKDLMLVETADMLRVPLFTAEGLLRNHDWSKEALIEAWMTDAAAACEKAGVTLPESHLTGDRDLGEKTKVSSTMQSCFRGSEVCSICDEEIVCEDVPLSLSCGHEFCRSCWESYLNVKIREGKAHSIQCPAFNCSALVPVETIESLVSREMARRYVQFDIKAFVESNPTLKWCPAPGCGRAVRLPSHMLPPLHVVQAGPSEETAPIVVDCGGGHFFCWHCSQEAHAPCTCELWSKWSKKIAEMMSKIPTVDDISECPETETVANTLWLVTNSKSCPNCKSPIQKNEGCNHMKCTKCKHEFCWVCLEQWKKHSSATGGYFRCNRFEVVQKIDAESVKAVNEANTKSMHITEINCFLHYYSRFKNHETSYKFEEPLLSTAKDKMMALALAAMETAATSPENADTSFIEGAVHELLKARRVLRASYAYGYYLTGNSDKKAIFESMQTEVEEATETLSQMVARPYLRTPRERIIQTTQLLHRKRQDFLLALSRGLIPEDDQPSIMPRVHLLSQLTNSRDSESDEDEDNYDEVCHTIEQSIRERLARLTLQEASLHPGAHSGDNPDEQASARERPCAFLHKKFNLTSCDLCNREKARDRREERKKRRRRQEPPQPPPEAEEEIDVDFMRAVQLSLLQHSTPAKRDSRQSSSSSSPGSTNSREGPVPIYSVADSTSLQRAIELSLQDSSVAEPSSTPPDDDLKRAIKLSLQDSGLPPESHDGSGNTDSPAPSQGSREPLDSDSNSEFDFCI